jgi:hypothetical protein
MNARIAIASVISLDGTLDILLGHDHFVRASGIVLHALGITALLYFAWDSSRRQEGRVR